MGKVFHVCINLYYFVYLYKMDLFFIFLMCLIGVLTRNKKDMILVDNIVTETNRLLKNECIPGDLKTVLIRKQIKQINDYLRAIDPLVSDCEQKSVKMPENVKNSISELLACKSKLINFKN